MKLKLFALIASILMVGTTGAFAQSIVTNPTPSSAGTVTSTAEVLPAAAVQKTAKSTANCNSTVTNIKTANSNADTTASALPGTSSSTCPKTTVSGQTVKASTQCNTSANSTANCTTNNCLNGINSKINSDCFSRLNSLCRFNFKPGNCTKNTTKSNSSCTSGSTPTTSGSSSSPKPTTPSSPSSSSGTSSAPASSGTQGNTSSTPSQTSGNYSTFQNKVVQLVNKERAANGLKALTVNDQLNKTATLKSEDMAKLNYFDHTSPTYGSPFDMMKKYGITYRSAGENIAEGQTTPEQVMQGWMNSPGHRANILNSSFTQIGVGIAKNAQNQYIWTQQFIG